MWETGSFCCPHQDKLVTQLLSAACQQCWKTPSGSWPGGQSWANRSLPAAVQNIVAKLWTADRASSQRYAVRNPTHCQEVLKMRPIRMARNESKGDTTQLGFWTSLNKTRNRWIRTCLKLIILPMRYS